MRYGLSKRTRGRLVALLAVAAALGAVSASAASSFGTGTAVVSGTFAGKADGAPVGVAVFAEAPAAEGQARTISVYLCNGSSLAAWLTTTTTGNEADLRSTDGRIGVHVVLTEAGARGKVGFLGGGGFRFTARPAVGIVGLYEVTVAADRTLQGTSTTGATVSGQVEGGSVAATATTGGQEAKLTGLARRVKPGAYRWIVLPDRKVYGANLRGPIFGGFGGVGIFHPTAGSTVRISAGSAGQKGFGNQTCQRLANQWNNLVDAAAKDILNNNDAGADAKLDKAQGVLNKLESHCVVVGLPL